LARIHFGRRPRCSEAFVVEDSLRSSPKKLRLSFQAPAYLAQGRDLAVPDRNHEVFSHEHLDLAEVHRLGLV
jgi:hypothetical protein